MNPQVYAEVFIIRRFMRAGYLHNKQRNQSLILSNIKKSDKTDNTNI